MMRGEGRKAGLCRAQGDETLARDWAGAIGCQDGGSREAPQRLWNWRGRAVDTPFIAETGSAPPDTPSSPA